MRYLGIDASTKSTGIALFDDDKLISHKCITASSTDVVNRIQKIIGSLDAFLLDNKVDLIILEEVRPASEGNIQTHRVLMWMQAAINFLIHDKFPNIKIDYVYPNEWRAWLGIHTGAGVRRESLKIKDIEWVKKNFNLELNDDEADAIGIVCGYKKKIIGEIPKEEKPKGAW